MDGQEEFTSEQCDLLKHYVTNVSGNVFALRNLPEVVKGALFSRYSRSNLGLRSLLLKEFIGNEEEAAFGSIVSNGNNGEGQSQALRRAQNFYDRILDGYGDDSIGELGGAHLALENISILAAKVIEDARIGGSPLEKSTRYVYFDHRVGGEYLFYREPVLMTSAFRSLYLDGCNDLFNIYSRLIAPTTALFEVRYPREEGVSKHAYNASLRSKVLDCLRGLLPAATLTNMGIFGNGRFFENLIQKLHCHSLVEVRELGRLTYEELAKVIPSFVRRAQLGHHTQKSVSDYYETLVGQQRLIAEQYANEPTVAEAGVKLLDWDHDAVLKVASALLFPYSKSGLTELRSLVEQLPEEEIARILDAASSSREQRRHKSPRALEHAFFTFEIVSNFAVYRDLQRHRMVTQERQFLTCDYGFHTPEELLGTELEGEYHEALCRAKAIYDTIRGDLPEEAQYIVPMAFNIRWYFHINLRSLQWITELRSLAQGHPSYRKIAQQMAQAVVKQFPLFERFFRFVDFREHDLGRLAQEERSLQKKESAE